MRGVAFVKVLGPKLKDAGVKLIALHCGCFGTSTTCASTCTSGDGYDYGHWLAKDAAAWAAVDIGGQPRGADRGHRNG
ncbi:MAG: hypothetical protein ABJB12_02235 [Pseudomonadota bacterium]